VSDEQKTAAAAAAATAADPASATVAPGAAPVVRPLTPTPRAKPVTVALINASTVVSDAEVEAVAHALNVQVNRDYMPIWGTDCNVVPVRKGKAPPKGAWWLTVLDNSDVAGALGYHDLTPDFNPCGNIFAATDQHYGLKWSVTASHELLEMLEDPWVNICAQAEDASGNVVLFAYEVCDQVESDEDSYEIDGVSVSNFVTPAWFGATEGYKGKYDFLGILKAPFTLAKGGYISVWSPAKGWTDMFGDRLPGQPPSTVQPKPGQRRYKRMIGKANWLITTADPTTALAA
jgi:hypothetical protein